MTFFVIHEILWVQFLTGLSTLESAQFIASKFRRSLFFNLLFALNNRNYIYGQWEKDCKEDDDMVLIIIKSAA